MLTKLDIANLALGKLGSTHQIVNVDTETTNIAKIIRRHYDIALESMLEEHPWGVFTKTGALNLVETDPSPKWKYAYALLDDIAVVRRLGAENYFPHLQEYLDELIPFEPIYSAYGYRIHTNLPDAWAEYTMRPSSEAALPTHFGRALATQLALDIAPTIITNNYVKMKDVLLRDAKIEISKQIAIDISLRPEPVNSDSPFIRARDRS